MDVSRFRDALRAISPGRDGRVDAAEPRQYPEPFKTRDKSRFRFIRASAVVNCQSALACVVFRLASQAIISLIGLSWSGMRRSRCVGPGTVMTPRRPEWSKPRDLIRSDLSSDGPHEWASAEVMVSGMPTNRSKGHGYAAGSFGRWHSGGYRINCIHRHADGRAILAATQWHLREDGDDKTRRVTEVHSDPPARPRKNYGTSSRHH